MNSQQNVYFALFVLSITLFLANILMQGPILFTYSDYFGLIEKMGPAFWAGYGALLILVCFQYANFRKIGESCAYLTLFLAVLYLIMTPFIYEKLPRFEDTWAHSFLAQTIFQNQRVDNGISVYEQYPGGIMFYGLLFHLIPSYYVMQFFPPLFYMFGMLVVFYLFKNNLGGRAAFLIAILYMFFSWTVEDNHISPQFLMLNIYFLFMYITIKFIEVGKTRIVYLALLGILGAAIVFSHPLTPIFLIFILGSVALLCKKYRTQALMVAAMLLIIFTVFEIYRTTTFDTMLGYIRGFIDVIRYGPKFESVTSRILATTLSRQLFIGSRIGLTAISVVLGLLGLILMRLQRFKTESSFFLAWAFALIPFTLMIGLAVRGEFYERFALISALPLSVAVTYLLGRYKLGFFAILIFLVALSPLFFIAKYGNEAIETLSMQKLDANCFLQDMNSDCAKNFKVLDNPLVIVQDFGKTSFVISREDIMANSIYSNTNIANVTGTISQAIQQYRLNKIYSTNTAGVYRY